jgi:tetratricopeptide (TPR) repeat protein
MIELSPEEAQERAKSLAQTGEISKAQDLLQATFNLIVKENFPGISPKENSSKGKLNISRKPPKQAVDRLVALYGKGNFSATVEAAQKLTSEYPEAFEVWNILGACYAQMGHSDGSITAFEQVIQLNPNFPDAHNNIGNVFKELGRLDDAIAAYKNALRLKPDYAAAYSNMSAALEDQGKVGEAIKAAKAALQIDPNHVEAYNALGNALRHQGRIEEATWAFKKAIKIKPDYAFPHSNLSVIYSDLGNYDEAINSSKLALRIDPHFVQGYSNAGNNYRVQGKLKEAIHLLKNAIKIRANYADAHHNLSYALLNSGRLVEGLDEYEWRWKVAKNVQKIRNFSRPLWDGRENLADSTVLVWHEQGVGDTINWSAYVSLLADRAKHCIFECPPKLVPLFTRSFPNIEVRAENRKLDAVRTDFDYHLPIGSLYRHFLSDICQRNNTEVFLRPAEDRVRFWKERLKSIGNGPYVGIGWKSSRMTLERMPNYAPIEEWAPLLKLSGVTFVNLQYSDFTSDLDQIQKDFGVSVHNFDDLDLLDDLDDVAALSLALDHVVSTTSAIPYISAGVGTSTMLASWKQSSWSSQPFYPSGPCVRKFDRNTWEPWNNVFNQIIAEI